PGPSPFRSTTAKVVAVRSGASGDREWTDVTIDIRLPPGRSARTFRDELPSLPTGSTLELIASIDPLELSRANPVARALEAGVRATGGQPTLWRKTGTSDLNLVVPAWTVPGAAYGPGDPHLDHSAFESISERELHRSVSVLAHAFLELSARPGAAGPA
ncbi:MAG: acetyl-lysine deacetylase, partial [Thermoplasmata archaeon]